jgi:hypothetical protein
MSADAPDDPRQSPPARQYLLVCLLSLLVLTLGLVVKGFGEWALPPLLLGVVGVVFHWRAAPALVPLLLVVLTILVGPAGLYYLSHADLEETDALLDPLLAAAALAYSLAHLRLLGLARHLFPPDARPLTATRPGRRTVRGRPHPRPPEAVGPTEVPLALLAVPLWAALGFVAWMILSAQESPLEEASWRLTRYQEDVRNALWRGVVVLWLGVLGLLLASAVLGYLRRLRAPLAENLLYLQDQLWRETRGEQSLLNRWLTWARLRAQKRKE